MTKARRRKSTVPEDGPKDTQDRVNAYLADMHSKHGKGPTARKELIPAYRALIAIGIGIRRGIIAPQDAQNAGKS